MLSRIYRYATVCYIGGGFTGNGIHNVLEAAVYGRRWYTGPNMNVIRSGWTAGGRGSFVADNAINLEKTVKYTVQGCGAV
jgi:3-deoxy-D-manno-octulosonic-acid transferase